MVSEREVRANRSIPVADRELEAMRDLLHLLGSQMQRRRGSATKRKASDIQWLDQHVLQVVAEHPGTSVKAVREHFRIPRSSLTSVINRLEKRGLLIRRIYAEDRRSYLLEATEAGRKVQEEHNRQDRDMARSLLRPLNGEERKLLVELLGKIVRGY